MRGNRLLPSTIGLFFEPKLAAPFLVGTVSLAIVSMALYDLIKDELNDCAFHARYLFLAIVVFGILVGAAYWLKAKYLEVTNIIAPRSPVAPQQKAVIVLGSDAAVTKKAIEHHIPVAEHAWIIASDRDTGMAERVKADLGQKLQSVDVRNISNPGDWYEASRIVRELVEKGPKGLVPSDFVVDFTGLTKPASIGAFLGALQVGAHLQYTPGKYTRDQEGKTTVEPLDPVRIEISFNAGSLNPGRTSPGSGMTS